MSVEDRFPKVKAVIEAVRNEDGRDVMRGWLDGTGYTPEPINTAERLAAGLRSEGFSISASTIRTYRRAVRASAGADA